MPKILLDKQYFPTCTLMATSCKTSNLQLIHLEYLHQEGDGCEAAAPLLVQTLAIMLICKLLVFLDDVATRARIL